MKNADGEYNQLSTSLLQTEAEFYSAIRAKPKPGTGDRPLKALHRRGIEYVELRCLDLNPLHPTGVDLETLRFLDAFLLYAWLKISALDTPQSWEESQQNQLTTVLEGRKPQLELLCDGERRSLTVWAREVLAEVELVATMLDEANASNTHRSSVQSQQMKIEDSSNTPSAQLLELLNVNSQSYYRCIDGLANEHRKTFTESTLDPASSDEFLFMAARSLKDQQVIEQAEDESLDTFLSAYMHLDF